MVRLVCAEVEGNLQVISEKEPNDLVIIFCFIKQLFFEAASAQRHSLTVNATVAGSILTIRIFFY